MSDFKQSDAYQITWLIRRLFRAMASKADQYLADLGISAAERAVLEFLYPDTQMTVPQIAERYGVSRQHVQVTVNSLLDKELVSTLENPQHKRSQFIMLNDNGRRLFTTVNVSDEQAINTLFASISDQDRRQTRQTLEILLNTLSEGT